MKATCSKRSLAAALAAAALASCGEDAPPPEHAHPVTASVHALQRAFAAGDAAEICELTTSKAQWQAGEVGHRDPTTCPRDMRRVFDMIQEGGGWGQHEKPSVAAIDVTGSRARVTLDLEGGWRATVPFTRTGGRWKLAAFFGDRLAAKARVERRGGVGPFPAGGRPVAAFEDEGKPCLALRGRARENGISDDGFPAGRGCSLKVTHARAPIRMLTPFGDFKFDDCSVDYRMLVDAEGRTWTIDWEVEGSDDGGCSDVGPCITPTARYEVAWRGRLRDDGRGGFVHHADACVNTCIGVFVGDLAMRLTPDRDGWRAEQENVDNSGFRIDAPLQVHAGGVRLEPAGAQRAAAPTG